MKHLITVALLVTATTAFAQTSPAPAPSDRWAPWMGCWQVSEESVEDSERLLSGLAGTPSAPTTRAGARVCVTSTDGGATLTTLVNDKPVSTETIIADGKPRPLTDPGCRGTQVAEWSPTATRIYARTELSCGNQPKRTVSGLSALISGPLWLDIQMIESQGRKSMRVRRYRPAANEKDVASSTRRLGTMPLGGTLSIADIKEVSAKLAPEVVQAAVIELGANGYDLNAKRLIELDDAGVPDAVIDLIVAMSFPKKFVVERAVPSSGPGGFSDFGGMWGPFAYWSYYAHPLYYSSYYSPFGYSYWGYYDPYYYRPPGVVIIPPGGGGSGIPEPSGAGRVVDGQGYTRIRPNVPDSPVRTGNGSGWGGASAGSSSGSNGGSTSGGSVSTGGYSGGGGGERVAVPRPPGRN